MRVYDLLGREMATLLSNEQLEEGYQTVSFEPSGMASGVYFYRMEAQGLEDEALKTIRNAQDAVSKVASNRVDSCVAAISPAFDSARSAVSWMAEVTLSYLWIPSGICYITCQSVHF